MKNSPKPSGHQPGNIKQDHHAPEPEPDVLPLPVEPDKGPTPDLLPDDPGKVGVTHPVA